MVSREGVLALEKSGGCSSKAKIRTSLLVDGACGVMMSRYTRLT